MQDHTWVEAIERRSPFGTLSVCDVRMRPSLRTRHEHGELHLCFVIDGGFEHAGARDAATMGPASARLSPAGAPADLRFGPDGARCFLIHLEGIEPADARWLTPARPTFLFDPETTRLARQAHRAFTEREEAPLELEALALELFAHAARAPMARVRPTPAWLVRARDEVRDRFAEPLVLAELAAEAGVTPVHLARAFRERYGCSMGAFLRAVRVGHVQRSLHAGVSLADAALAGGFFDQAHMTRVFRRALGVTPGSYKAAVAA